MGKVTDERALEFLRQRVNAASEEYQMLTYVQGRLSLMAYACIDRLPAYIRLYENETPEAYIRRRIEEMFRDLAEAMGWLVSEGDALPWEMLLKREALLEAWGKIRREGNDDEIG